MNIKNLNTEFLDIAQFADVSRVTKRTARRYLRDNKVFAIKLGRRWLIPKDAVAKLVAGL